MRRMTDIVVTPDDRLANSAPARPRRAKDEPRADARAASEPRPRKTKRKTARARIDLTPLQKLAAGGVAVTALVVGAAALWHSGAPQRLARAAVDRVLAVTAEAGFRVEEITVAGRNRTSTDRILAALGAGYGAPILAVDIGEVKDRLEAIPSVRSAAVERRLPGQLHLALVEREPVAIWQSEGEFTLIDREGRQIPGSLAGYSQLPLVVGQGAPPATEGLLSMLATEPKLAARVKAAVRVGGRRWNLRLDDPEHGIELRLPEDAAEDAWHRVADLDRQHDLAGRAVTMLDLRVPDRLILRTAHEQAAAGHRKDSGA